MERGANTSRDVANRELLLQGTADTNSGTVMQGGAAVWPSDTALRGGQKALVALALFAISVGLFSFGDALTNASPKEMDERCPTIPLRDKVAWIVGGMVVACAFLFAFLAGRDWSEAVEVGTAIVDARGEKIADGLSNDPVHVRTQVPCVTRCQSLFDDRAANDELEGALGRRLNEELGRMVETQESRDALAETHKEYVLFTLWLTKGGTKKLWGTSYADVVNELHADVVNELHNGMGELRTEGWFETDRVEAFLERYKGQEIFVSLYRYLRCQIWCGKDKFIREVEKHVTDNGLTGAGSSLQRPGQRVVDRAVAGCYVGTISDKGKAPC